MQNGLSVGIINPGSEDMMKAWYAFHALMALDSNCEKYIARYAQQPGTTPVQAAGGKHTDDIAECVERGLKEEASSITAELASRKMHWISLMKN